MVPYATFAVVIVGDTLKNEINIFIIPEIFFSEAIQIRRVADKVFVFNQSFPERCH